MAVGPSRLAGFERASSKSRAGARSATRSSPRPGFYLASTVPTALAAAAFVRVHWGIENSLHWALDMVMRDDESRVRTGNAAANLAIIKHIAYNLIRRGKGKHSFRAR